MSLTKLQPFVEFLEKEAEFRFDIKNLDTDLFGFKLGYAGLLAIYAFFLFRIFVTKYKYDKKLRIL